MSAEDKHPIAWDREHLIIVPHGITPSGWGVFMGRTSLAPMTPCCGAATGSGKCCVCKEKITYQTDYPVQVLNAAPQKLKDFISKVTGIPVDTIELTLTDIG